MPVNLAPDVAYEYLDDGGVLACYLPDGQMWQLGSPAGQLWRLVATGCDLDDLVETLRAAVGVGPSDGRDGVLAFCESMEVLGLIDGSWRHDLHSS